MLTMILFNVATVGINTAANITDMVTALSAIGYDAFDDLIQWINLMLLKHS